MNERIRELAEQASHQSIPYSKYFAEKFAELIVLECVQVVNAADESCEDYYGPIIKEHFGVEE